MPIECDYCEYTATPSVVKRHITAVHKKEKPFTCEYCDYKTSRNDRLESHIQIVHYKKKPYVCQYCDYKAPFKSKLNHHTQQFIMERNCMSANTVIIKRLLNPR